VDDVISTGGSLHALETLAAKSTGTVVGCCAALAEGDAAKRTDIFFLEPLPLFLH
ncbi:MAG TPA: adenine phosphoribosyltransferase, partial [Gemmiger formicilis]|nr:adenine phosphoribosyltransferase [Gemmiger formicilis]